MAVHRIPSKLPKFFLIVHCAQRKAMDVFSGGQAFLLLFKLLIRNLQGNSSRSFRVVDMGKVTDANVS